MSDVVETPPAGSDRRKAELRLVAALRGGDAAACGRFIDDNHASMVRLAFSYVRSPELAEDVAQEAWAALFRGIHAFEGRSTVRSWLFSIVLNRARSCRDREFRSTSVSQLVSGNDEQSERSLEQLFHGEGHPESGRWAIPPARWHVNPEDELLSREMGGVIDRAVAELPEAQRVVFMLRQLEGWKTEEVAGMLGRTPNWVRVVLHRARMRVRSELEHVLRGRET